MKGSLQEERFAEWVLVRREVLQRVSFLRRSRAGKRYSLSSLDRHLTQPYGQHGWSRDPTVVRRLIRVSLEHLHRALAIFEEQNNNRSIANVRNTIRYLPGKHRSRAWQAYRRVQLLAASIRMPSSRPGGIPAAQEYLDRVDGTLCIVGHNGINL